ncbi:hypothetical protein HYX19_01115 [Candidatus Woesearchaeota archaeon]|nr:hypothetical protein [Candidatus Woesearchaeota archaeon]
MISRREILKDTFGLVGILVGAPGIASSEEVYGIKELRKYAKLLYATKKNSINPLIFSDTIEDKQVKIEVGNLDRDLGDKTNLTMVVLDVLNGQERTYNIETYIDIGIKGNLLGSEDRIYIGKTSGESREDATWIRKGSYYLEHRIKNKDCKKRDISEMGLCNDGIAYYVAGSEEKIELTGIYKTIGHAKLKARGREEFKRANSLYTNFLKKAIIALEKAGELKIK